MVVAPSRSGTFLALHVLVTAADPICALGDSTYAPTVCGMVKYSKQPEDKNSNNAAWDVILHCAAVSNLAS